MMLGITSIAIVIIATLLVTRNLIKEKYYPYAIGLMAFGLVYSITLLGSYVIGSDIQGEVAASRIALESGWRSIGILHPNVITGINMTSIVTMILIPGLSRFLRMDVVWVYKLIIPLFLAAVPVVMYYVFEKQTDSKRAFYAALFFIIMPVYNLQLTGIAKSMLAELFFALMILAMVSTWNKWHKVIIITSCMALAVICHYTIGVAMLAYLFGIIVIRLVTTRLNWKLWMLRRTPVFTMLIALLISLGTFGVYYNYAQGGMINQVMGRIVGWYGGNTAAYTTEAMPDIVITDGQTTPGKMYLYRQEYAVQVGIGLDFFGQPIEGKLFRIVQYLTQLLIVIGTFRLLKHHYRFTAEFIAGIGCSFVLLLICIFVPQFSTILNMPRFYQISLFFLAPMLVLGCESFGKGKS